MANAKKIQRQKKRGKKLEKTMPSQSLRKSHGDVLSTQPKEKKKEIKKNKTVFLSPQAPAKKNKHPSTSESNSSRRNDGKSGRARPVRQGE